LKTALVRSFERRRKGEGMTINKVVFTMALAFPLTMGGQDVTLKSRKSFDELVAAKDKDILYFLHSANPTYFCFMPDEDEFTILTYTLPHPNSWIPLKKDGSSFPAVNDYHTFAFVQYRDGLSYSSRHGTFHWVKYFSDSDPASTESKDMLGEKFPFELTVNGEEADVAFSFENEGNTITRYSLVIQQSTKRFVRTLSTGDPNNPAIHGQSFTVAGRCILGVPVTGEKKNKKRSEAH
jgi:hypothetical protein